MRVSGWLCSRLILIMALLSPVAVMASPIGLSLNLRNDLNAKKLIDSDKGIHEQEAVVIEVGGDIVEGEGEVDHAKDTDVYLIQLTEPAQLEIQLEGMVNDVDLYLSDDNSKPIARSEAPKEQPDYISSLLPHGLYVIRVSAYSESAVERTKYKLRVVATTISEESTMDAGNTPESATDLGMLQVGGYIEYVQEISTQDDEDWYMIAVSEPNADSQLHFELSDLRDDIDIQIYLPGEMPREGTKDDAQPESVQWWNAPGGTYFIRVVSFLQKKSRYKLTIKQTVGTRAD